MPTSPTSTAVDERTLLRRWADHGDQDALGALWSRHQRLVVVVAARILQGVTDPLQEARELADDSFLEALRTWRPERARPGSSAPFRSWWLTVVRSRALDRRRRLSRIELLADPPPTHTDPRDQLVARVDLDHALPRIRALILSDYLPVDVTLFERWLECVLDGRRVPWKQLAGELPVDIDTVIRFEHGSARLESLDGIDEACVVLDRAPVLHSDVVGVRAEDEAPELAARRARVVQAAVTERMRQPRARRRRGAPAEPRLTVRSSTTPGAPSVRFRTTHGRHRTPDALRMRLEKVILRRVRAMLDGDGP